MHRYLCFLKEWYHVLLTSLFLCLHFACVFSSAFLSVFIFVRSLFLTFSLSWLSFFFVPSLVPNVVTYYISVFVAVCLILTFISFSQYPFFIVFSLHYHFILVLFLTLQLSASKNLSFVPKKTLTAFISSLKTLDLQSLWFLHVFVISFFYSFRSRSLVFIPFLRLFSICLLFICIFILFMRICSISVISIVFDLS